MGVLCEVIKNHGIKFFFRRIIESSEYLYTFLWFTWHPKFLLYMENLWNWWNGPEKPSISVHFD